jgi:hypothetical protein
MPVKEDISDKLFHFSTTMAGASIAVVGLLLIVTYEFQHAGEAATAFNWMHITHIGIASALSFCTSSIIGLFQKLPKKHTRLIFSIMVLALAIGCFFLFWVLAELLMETT